MDAKRRESLPIAKPTNLAARVRAFSERLRETPVAPDEGGAATAIASLSAEAMESLSLRREGLLVVDDDGAGLLEEERRRRRVVFDLAPEARIVADANVAATVPADALRRALQERERMLEDSRRQCSELATAQRERDVTMAVLAHELRGPMSAILGWTRLLRHPRIDPEQRERALEVIEQNALLQRALVDDLMDASRLLAQRVEIERLPLNLSQVVGWVTDGAQPRAAEKGITLSCEVAVGCVVQGDGWRLSQVVTNLLANSLKFTPTGGSVSVTLSASDGVATLRVADTGVGIAPEHLPRIFDRFHQANQSHNSAGGLGLGLFLVREIVEMHGGTVIGESPGEGRGQGSVFTVTLPLSTDEG